MNKRKLSGYFLFLSISTFLAVFFFIFQKSYDNLMNDSLIEENASISQGISPNLDIKVLDEIEKRQGISP